MVKSTAVKKIIWALDAFDETTQLQSHAAHAIKQFYAKTNAVIEPVYIMTPAELNLSVEFSMPWITQYRPAAEKALRSIVEQHYLPNTTEPHILIQNTSSTTDAVKTLSRYANRTGADLIVVSTHGRSGVSRLLLGSFAERLLLRSSVPVLVVGPEMRRHISFNHILFPTDFGKTAQNVFRQVVAMARELEARVTLFHVIPRPIEPVFQSGVYLLGGSWVPVQSYFSTESERQKRHALKWQSWARHQGVKVDTVIDAEGGNIVEGILELARKKKAGLVAMEAVSGPIASSLIGSVARQVIRHVDCPVWAFRARGAAIARTRPSGYAAAA